MRNYDFAGTHAYMHVRVCTCVCVLVGGWVCVCFHDEEDQHCSVLYCSVCVWNLSSVNGTCERKKGVKVEKKLRTGKVERRKS